MKKTKLGILLGILAGIIDVIPMIIKKLTWDANLSAFAFWAIAGFLISSSNLKIKGWRKGLFISVLSLMPVGILAGWQEPTNLIPISIMTLILGSSLGFFIDKYGR